MGSVCSGLYCLSILIRAGSKLSCLQIARKSSIMQNQMVNNELELGWVLTEVRVVDVSFLRQLQEGAIS